MPSILITGNTFPVKDQIKALGGRWDAQAKGWMVPADKADQARRLVSGGSATRRPLVYGRYPRGNTNRGAGYQCSCAQCRRGNESGCLRD